MIITLKIERQYWQYANGTSMSVESLEHSETNCYYWIHPYSVLYGNINLSSMNAFITLFNDTIIIYVLNVSIIAKYVDRCLVYIYMLLSKRRSSMRSFNTFSEHFSHPQTVRSSTLCFLPPIFAKAPSAWWNGVCTETILLVNRLHGTIAVTARTVHSDNLGYFYWHESTLISTWISNPMPG